jgi:hypothetical protein
VPCGSPSSTPPPVNHGSLALQRERGRAIPPHPRRGATTNSMAAELVHTGAGWVRCRRRLGAPRPGGRVAGGGQVDESSADVEHAEGWGQAVVVGCAAPLPRVPCVGRSCYFQMKSRRRPPPPLQEDH